MTGRAISRSIPILNFVHCKPAVRRTSMGCMISVAAVGDASEKLTGDIEDPKISRPSKYRSDVERETAKREQNRLSSAMSEKNPFIQGIRLT